MKKLLLMGALGLGIFLAACDKNESDSANGMSKVNIKLTDAPGAYDALYLNVKEVQVLTSSGQTTLAVNSNPFNILNFRMGKDTLLASQDIPSGTIQEVRVVLNETGNNVVINGTTYPLTTPSGQSSGIKLKVHDDLQAGVDYTMTLDFDAAKSIVQTGNGKYILKPVIRAIPNAVSGVITGIIAPTSSNSKVYAITGTDTLGSVADVMGKFWFPGVAAGIYKVQIQPESPYQAKTIDSVIVTNGSIKDLGTITLSNIQ